MTLGKRGDTIVEVLVALTVTSLLLGGALATTNKSLVSVRQSQERAEALKVAESQAESLRALGALASTQAASFCFNAVGIPSGAPCSVGTIPYSVTITHPGDARSFLISVRWDRIGGGNQEQVNLRYAVY